MTLDREEKEILKAYGAKRLAARYPSKRELKKI
jgi:hypothetical protein